MTQPDYVPITPADRVRPVERLPTPLPWWARRPADLRGSVHPLGALLGVPGPDQGYALQLAERFRERLVLAAGESPEDAMAGCLGVALRRATAFDRSPVIYDLELAFTLWGFLGDAPEDLLAHRRPLFQSAAHDYWSQRAIAAAVTEQALRLSPAQVREHLGDWRSLVDMAIVLRGRRLHDHSPTSVGTAGTVSD
ncbi:MAG TPA: hypothetical protein VE152_12465 [Acidimicrobiales bacterium]|nr:hypothetical protein [Acidimicrobiales bacterium]